MGGLIRKDLVEAGEAALLACPGSGGGGPRPGGAEVRQPACATSRPPPPGDTRLPERRDIPLHRFPRLSLNSPRYPGIGGVGGGAAGGRNTMELRQSIPLGLGIGAGMGIALGSVVGLVFDAIPLGIGIGFVVGSAAGLLVGLLYGRRRTDT